MGKTANMLDFLVASGTNLMRDACLRNQIFRRQGAGGMEGAGREREGDSRSKQRLGNAPIRAEIFPDLARVQDTGALNLW